VKNASIARIALIVSVTIPLALANSGCSTTATANTAPTVAPTHLPTGSPTPANQFMYLGVDDETVLEVLEKVTHNDVQLHGSGANAFVVGINGRIADTSKHEFWALYVNGKFAREGAGSLETHTGDQIKWQIEIY
jgi:hypothetical protein